MFTKQGEFKKKVTDLTDVPSQNMPPSEIKTYFQTPNDELKTTLNQLIDDLTNNGAKNIGVDAINGLSGSKIQDYLSALKTITDNKTDVTGNHQGHWQGFTPQMIGAPEMNSARITAAESKLLEHTSNLAENTAKRPSMIPNTLSKLNRGEDTLILCAGDSVTHGIRPLAVNMLYTDGYVYKFAQSIAVTYPKATVKVVIGNTTSNQEDRAIDTWTEYTIQTGTNGQTITVVRSGVGGDTLLRMFRRMNDIVQYNGKKPDLVITMEGINDSLDWVPQKYAPVDRYEKGYQTYIQYIKRVVGCEIVIQTSHWIGDNLTQSIDTYIPIQKRIALSEQIQIVDQNTLWRNHYDSTKPNFGQDTWLDSSDNCHPTPTGHTQIANKLFNDLFIENQLIRPITRKPLQLIKYDNNKIVFSSEWYVAVHNINANSNTTYSLKSLTDSTKTGTISATLKGKKIYLLTRVGLALDHCTVQVDSLPTKTLNFGTTYPTDTTDVSDGAICSYFYERFLIADGLADAEHTISVTNAHMMEFYGFEVETDDSNYYSDFTVLPVQNAGRYSVTADGTKDYAWNRITFNKTHKNIPVVIPVTNSKDYICAVVNETTTTAEIYVGKRDGTLFANGVVVSVKWQSFDTN